MAAGYALSITDQFRTNDGLFHLLDGILGLSLTEQDVFFVDGFQTVQDIIVEFKITPKVSKPI